MRQTKFQSIVWIDSVSKLFTNRSNWLQNRLRIQIIHPCRDERLKNAFGTSKRNKNAFWTDERKGNVFKRSTIQVRTDYNIWMNTFRSSRAERVFVLFGTRSSTVRLDMGVLRIYTHLDVSPGHEPRLSAVMCISMKILPLIICKIFFYTSHTTSPMFPTLFM